MTQTDCGIILMVWRADVAVTDDEYAGRCSTRLVCHAAVYPCVLEKQEKSWLKGFVQTLQRTDERKFAKCLILARKESLPKGPGRRRGKKRDEEVVVFFRR